MTKLSSQRTAGTGILETYNRGINEFKKGYQPTSNIIKEALCYKPEGRGFDS
jgi:hypothetical protein